MGELRSALDDTRSLLDELRRIVVQTGSASKQLAIGQRNVTPFLGELKAVHSSWIADRFGLTAEGSKRPRSEPGTASGNTVG
jgi:hypothetical protein